VLQCCKSEYFYLDIVDFEMQKVCHYFFLTTRFLYQFLVDKV